MLRLVEAILVTVALLGACGGVGGAILRWAGLDEPGEKGPARPLSFGVAAALGLALLVALGGVGLVLRIPVLVVVVAFTVAGIALLAFHVARHRPSWTGIFVVVLGIEVLAFGLVLLTQAGVGIAFRLNVCDDVLAYLPEARRLLATHTLLEPWSTRRLQNFGGQTFLQAIYVRFLGNDALGLVETILPVGLLWLLISTALRRPLTRALSLVPLVFLPFFDVPRVNTAGTLSPVPLLVALGVLVLVLRRAAEQANRRGTVVAAAAVGTTAAAIVAVRTNAAPAAGLVAVVGACMIAGTAREKARSAAVTVGAGVMAFAPWSAAMWESSGTPLYPLLRGNENPRVPSVGITGSVDLADFVHSVRRFFGGGIYPVALAVLLVIIVLARKAFPKTAPIAALMIGAGLANLVLLALSLSGAGISDFDHYSFPVVGGALFFVVRGAFVRLDEEASLARRVALAPAVLAVVALVAFFWIGTRHPDAIVEVRSLDAAREFVNDAADVRDPDAQVTPHTSVANARAALAAIPPRAKILVEVSEPDAFLATGADVQSLDEPGSAAPGGEFPFFSGAEAKVRAMRSHDYDYLVVSPSLNHRCYQRGHILDLVHSPVLTYRRLAPFLSDFFADMDDLAQRYPRATRWVNGFYVVDLRAVPGTAPRRVDA